MNFEPWVVGDPSPNVGSHSEATPALNADIEILTVAKDTLEIIPVKALFESVIIILGLVRVMVIVLLPFFYSFLGDTVRTRWWTTTSSWNWQSTASERATC